MMNSSEWHAGRIAKKLRLRAISFQNLLSSALTEPVSSPASPSSLTPRTAPRLTKFQKVVLVLALIVSAALLTLSVVLHVNDSRLSHPLLTPALLASVYTRPLSIWTIPPTTTSVLSGMVNNV